MEPAYIYRADVVRIIDADTYRLRIDCGFRVMIEVDVRLHGFDAPERNTPEGVAAAAAVHQLLARRPVLVQTYRDQRSFARWVADVYVDGKPLGPMLEKAGHATRR